MIYGGSTSKQRYAHVHGHPTGIQEVFSSDRKYTDTHPLGALWNTDPFNLASLSLSRLREIQRETSCSAKEMHSLHPQRTSNPAKPEGKSELSPL